MQVLPPLQWLVWVHSTHMFMDGSTLALHAGLGFMQPMCGSVAPFTRQGTQVLVVGSQAGVAAPQSASLRQLTQTLSSGLALVTQNLPAPQSTSPKQGTHLWVLVVSQMGLGAMQSAFIKQPTHAFLVTSIASFRHFGVAPAQSPLTKQAVQRCVVARSQIGLTPEHCSIAVHSTQAFSVGSTLVKHWLSGATHAVELVDVQLTHLFAPRSQAGVAPEQLISAKHCTQLFIAGLTLTLH